MVLSKDTDTIPIHSLMDSQQSEFDYSEKVCKLTSLCGLRDASASKNPYQKKLRWSKKGEGAGGSQFFDSK